MNSQSVQTKPNAAAAVPKPNAGTKDTKKDTKKLKGMSFAEGEEALAPKDDAGAKKTTAKKGGPLGPGSEGPEVVALQTKLTRLSKEAEICQDSKDELRPGPINGKFGKKTEAAVMSFQSWQQLPMTGIVDAETTAQFVEQIAFLDMLAAMDTEEEEEVPKAPTGALTIGSAGPEVLALQTKLKRLSKDAEICQDFKAELDPGALDGKFGKGVAAAVRSFQSWQNTAMTGIADAATIAAIDAEIDFINQSGG